MGIDIYARWAGQTEAERKGQITGFSTRHGHVGYLREAYHGGPYATRALVAEAFADDRHHTCDEDGRGNCEACKGAPIPAATLRRRLPTVATLVLLREAEVYHDAKARTWLCEHLSFEPRAPKGNGDCQTSGT